MIKIRNLSKKFGDRILFENISFEFERGSVTGIFGESGSGKSTLLNILGLLDDDYSGEIKINNTLIMPKNRRVIEKLIRYDFFFLFQNYALVDNDSVEDNLMIALEYTRYTKKQKREKIIEALEKVGLSKNILSTPIYILSGGEQQRVALSRVYLKPNTIILADEPTGNLDKKNSEAIMRILFDLAHKENKVVVIVSHDLKFMELCDRVIQL